MSTVSRPAFVQSIARLACTACGAEANASCNCGKPYVPASARATQAIVANPDKSNRAIAADVGLSEATVRRARASQDAPDTVTGRDGKEYPAHKPRPKRKADPILDAIFKGEAGDACVMRAMEADRLANDPLGPALSDDCGTDCTKQERWQTSLSNLAGDAISMEAYWSKQFGEWESFEKTSELVILAAQAAGAWMSLANKMTGQVPSKKKH